MTITFTNFLQEEKMPYLYMDRNLLIMLLGWSYNVQKDSKEELWNQQENVEIDLS